MAWEKPQPFFISSKIGPRVTQIVACSTHCAACMYWQHPKDPEFSSHILCCRYVLAAPQRQRVFIPHLVLPICTGSTPKTQSFHSTSCAACSTSSTPKTQSLHLGYLVHAHNSLAPRVVCCKQSSKAARQQSSKAKLSKAIPPIIFFLNLRAHSYLPQGATGCQPSGQGGKTAMQQGKAQQRKSAHYLLLGARSCLPQGATWRRPSLLDRSDRLSSLATVSIRSAVPSLNAIDQISGIITTLSEYLALPSSPPVLSDHHTNSPTAQFYRNTG